MNRQPLYPQPGIPHPKPDVLLRTRRTVMEAANEMQEQKIRSRRKLGVALLCMGVLLLVMTPTIWISVDDMLGGEHFFDMPAMMLALVAVFITTILAALMMGWKRQQEVRHDR